MDSFQNTSNRGIGLEHTTNVTNKGLLVIVLPCESDLASGKVGEWYSCVRKLGDETAVEVDLSPRMT